MIDATREQVCSNERFMQLQFHFKLMKTFKANCVSLKCPLWEHTVGNVFFLLFFMIYIVSAWSIYSEIAVNLFFFRHLFFNQQELWWMLNHVCKCKLALKWAALAICPYSAEFRMKSISCVYTWRRILLWQKCSQVANGTKMAK